METLSEQTVKTFPINIPPHTEKTEPVDEHMKRVLIKAVKSTEDNRIFLVFVSREHAERLLEIVSELFKLPSEMATKLRFTDFNI